MSASTTAPKEKSAMSEQWYLARAGNKYGPMSSPQLKFLAASGEICPADLLWLQGTDGWKPAASITGPFPQASFPTNPRGGSGQGLHHATTSLLTAKRIAIVCAVAVAFVLPVLLIRLSSDHDATTTTPARNDDVALPDFSEVDYSVSFSDVDYSPVQFASLDYEHGPNGEIIEELDGYDDKSKPPGNFTLQGFIQGGHVTADEAQWRQTRQSSLKNANKAGRFVSHGKRIVWWKPPTRESRFTERAMQEAGQPPKPNIKAPGVKRLEEHWFNGVLHGESRSWYEDGQLSLQHAFVNGKPHGKRVGWWPNGEKKLEDYWIEGKQHGVQKGWHENGQQAVEGNFVEGKEHGKWIYWYDNGNKETEDFFIHGLRHGLVTKWHRNGQKAAEIAYVDGKEVGHPQEWDENGNDLWVVREQKRQKQEQRLKELKVQAGSTLYTLRALEQSADFSAQIKNVTAGSREDFVQAVWILGGGGTHGHRFTEDDYVKIQVHCRLKIDQWTAVFGEPQQLSDGYDSFTNSNYQRWSHRCVDGPVTIHGNWIDGRHFGDGQAVLTANRVCFY